MNLIEFINKYMKTAVDYDKKFGPQCVDLFRQYCADVLEVPHTGSVDGAKDLYLNYDLLPKEVQYFKRVKGSSGLKPGDVIIWDKNETNKYGHAAIFLYKDGTDFIVMEQNGIKQDGTKFAARNSTNLLGYLRFRK